MITEDFVSFETAKLLREKGFPQDYDVYYSKVYNEEDYEDEYEVQRMVLQTQHIKAGTLSSYPIGVPEPKCYCPTQSLVVKWLREEHKIWFLIYRDFNNQKWDYGVYHYDYAKELNSGDEHYYDTYEQAVEAALKYSLENLI